MGLQAADLPEVGLPETPVIRAETGRQCLAAFTVLVLAGAVWTPVLQSQTPRWEANATGTRVSYDTLSALNAPSVGGLLEWRESAMVGRISGGVTAFDDAGWTLHGSGDLSRWLTPSATSPVRLELAGSGSASRHSSGFDTYLLRADARVHWVDSRWGIWAGLGVARSRSAADSIAADALVPGAGVWGRLGDARLSLSYQAPDVYERRFHELSSALTLSSERTDFTAFAGWRGVASSSGIPSEAWAGATAAVWVRPSTALVVSGGRYGPDALQGLPGGSFVSIGIRLTSRRTRPTPEGAARAPMLFSGASAARGTIGFRLPGARSVEVAGDWNDWTPQPLTPDPDGRWTLPPGLEPGIYRFNLRVDGMRWIVPDGVPSADDGFGGEVGILIIRDGP